MRYSLSDVARVVHASQLLSAHQIGRRSRLEDSQEPIASTEETIGD